MGNVNGNIVRGVVIGLTTVAIGVFEFMMGKKTGYIQGRLDAISELEQELNKVNDEFLAKHQDISIESEVEED